MNQRIIKILININIILLITLITIIIYNVTFSNSQVDESNNTKQVKDNKEIEELKENTLQTLDTIEDILDYLEKEYGEENCHISFKEENDISWIFFKQTLDDTVVEIYLINKETKSIVIGS